MHFDFSHVAGHGWYPGHMRKAAREIQDKLKLVDLAIILADARCPGASINPDLLELVGAKPAMLVLNKADLAEAAVSQAWLDHLRPKFSRVILTTAKNRTGCRSMMEQGRAVIDEERAKRGATRPLLRPRRLLIMGVPNLGKSTLINALAGKASARTGPKPGVTVTQQWIRLADDMELLDTPGIMPPGNPGTIPELNLGLAHIIRQDIIGLELLATWLILKLICARKTALLEPFGFTLDAPEPHAALNAMAVHLNFIQHGAKPDPVKVADLLLRRLSEGHFGALSLENPPGTPEALLPPGITVKWPLDKV